MRLPETYHRYSRLMMSTIAWLATLLVVLAVGNLGLRILRGVWDLLGLNTTLINWAPWLESLIIWLDGQSRPQVTSAYELLPNLLGPLGWAALALLVVLYLRNALPAVRVSHVGVLVEFAGSWLPLRWEELRNLKVTQDLDGERFVIFVEVQPGKLTSWHRFYGLLYGLRWKPGFLISSHINQFEQLIQTMLSQSERTARAVDDVQALQLREDMPSLLFRFLLSPAAFFSRRSSADVSGQTMPLVEGGPVHGAYPPRINAIMSGVTLGLGLMLLINYLGYWVRFLALSFPGLRPFWPFSGTLDNPGYAELFNAFRTQGVPFMGVATRSDLPSPWWLLVAAHLMLLLGIPALLWLRSALPNLEVRDEGMTVHGLLGARRRLIPWTRIKAFKATEVSEQSQVLLLQSPNLPAFGRISGLIYDGSMTPGVLITSAIANFQPLLGHALNQIAPLEEEGGPQILQQEAQSWLIWLTLGRRAALKGLVETARADLATKALDLRATLAASGPMALLALFPALLLLVAGLLGDAPPGAGLLAAATGLWLFAMLEWPLMSLGSVLLDENSGGGEEGYRALYLYPTSQLPRLLTLLAALLILVVGVPLLALMAWIGALAWSYWLASDFFAELYEWRGSQVILGGLLPVLWQLLILIGFLVAAR
jgi:hypothetical protein